jgi:hypothetical protein
MIAGEALFISDQEDKELSYRLSLRAARFVDLAPVSRLNVLRFMRRAYGARSKIVHGSWPTSFLLLSGQNGGIGDFTQDLETVMRKGLAEAVERTARDGSFGIDWDDLVLG